MKVFIIVGTVEDDGTSREVSAAIVAPTKREARRLARAVLIGAYEDNDPGWVRRPRVEPGSLFVNEADISSPCTLLTQVDGGR